MDDPHSSARLQTEEENRETRSEENGPRFRVKIVTSRAGAGHSQVAAALADALQRRYPERVDVMIVDALKDYTPFPYKYFPELYAYWCEWSPVSYGWYHRLTDGRRRADLVLQTAWPWVKRGMRNLLTDTPLDAVVCVHSLENHLLTWARRQLKLATPLITMVTDPISAHAVWLAPEADAVLVGSETVRRKAVAHGISPDRVTVTGHPVNSEFIQHLMDRRDARAILGWHPDQPGVLLVGGGDGVGGLEKHARALDEACGGIQIAVVTGRNRRLLRKLRGRRWRNTVHFYGFVDHATEMAFLMSATDLLVTKAGPGTLHDAYLAGLPIVMSGAIPSQEDGNVTQVLGSGAGVWAPEARTVADLTRSWFTTDRAALDRMAACSRALARPDAAEAAAEEVWRVMTSRPRAGAGAMLAGTR